jgi:hypothetical protein
MRGLSFLVRLLFGSGTVTSMAVYVIDGKIDNDVIK